MAATLTADQEIVHFSFPIEKTEQDPATGTVYVYGKATSPEVDSDEQIVDPDWSAKAIETWFATGPNVRVMHNATAMPAGSGVKVEIDRDGDGGHWVKAAVDEPTAKLMVLRKHLRAFSVGITKPLIARDTTGKARGGIIRGGELAEISLVDRPANRSCYVEIAKSASDGSCEFTGKVFGTDDFITKAAAEEASTVTVDLPKSATVTFSPADLAKLLEHRRVAEDRQAQALKRDFDPDVGGGVDRDKLPDSDFAGRNRSFPIVTAADVSDALHSIGRAGPGNYSPAKLRRNILRIARRKGFPVPESDRGDGKKADSSKAAKPGRKCKLCHGTGKIRDGEMECPRCHGDGIRSPGEPDEHGKKAAEGAPVSAAKSGTAAVSAPPQTAAAAKDDGGDAHEPVMHHDDGQDDDTDSDADANDKAAGKAAKPGKMPCPKCSAKCKAGSRFCGKCGSPMTAAKADRPTPADHATGAAARDMQPAPAHREPDGPAIEALEHDAHLPTVPDSSVKTAMRLSALGVPSEYGMLHGLLCPAYAEASVKAAWPGADFSLIDEQAWQAKALETAAAAPLEEAQKAAQVWTAARELKAVSPDLYDDIMTEARKAFRDANPGPGSAPEPGEISAERYNRPYITAGHSAPSPEHDAPHTAPIHPGHISAADFHRGLITDGHAADSPENSPSRPEPVPAPPVPGVPSRVFYTRMQRQNAEQAMRAMHDHIAQTFPDLCPMHGPGRMGEPPSHARPVAAGVGGPVPHGASKSADPQAKKAAKMARKARKQEKAARARLAENTDPAAGEAVTPGGVPAFDPAIVKAAVTEATVPLLEKLAAQDDTLRKYDKALKKQAKMLDAIAGQPDPAVTAYRGAAIAKSSTAAPAGPVGIRERAALAQENLIIDRTDIARNSPDPAQRLQAMWDLMDYHGLTGRTP